MAEDAEQLLDEANRLLEADPPDLAGLVRKAKQLYIAGHSIPSRKLQQKAAQAARAEAEALLEKPDVPPGPGKTLSKILQAANDYGLARRLLSRIRKQLPHDVRVAQQLALCTYKDEELAPDTRFADALAILDAIGLRDPQCDDPETLGQGGAVHKRRWARTGRIEDLHTSLHFYSKGWQSNPSRDMGYCGVNAAYLLDVLAYRAYTAAQRDSAEPTHAHELAERARQLREDMNARLPEFAAGIADIRQQYWYLVTMAEISFGLKDWSAAEAWLRQARGAEHDEWERQTAAVQMVSIGRMGGLLPPESSEPAEWPAPWRALHQLLGEDALAAFESFRGKVGLALSGGGFRASLFHLGVLARLAECDALRSVEVLSTVSGGSIVGAHYYLALRHRLRTSTDAEIRAEDYIATVQNVMRQFCAGVRKNLRVRLFASLRANLKMIWPFGPYGRSNRIGELYEEHLYAGVDDGLDRPRKLEDLLIHPLLKKGADGTPDERDESFKPKFSNWRRRAKVPILLLNATSLNSGHSWHFTASWMGEPPGLMGQEVDMNERYRRLYYWQAPTAALQGYPLSYAVAASSGVPALFDPLILEGLYPGRTVRLVDGGVHDNQGVAGLLDESCSVVLCSDACGQMDDQDSPASNELSVLLRSNGILQDRVREAQYQDLAWRLQSNALQGLFFIHLKEELDTDPIDWIRCKDRTPPGARRSATTYQVDRTLQRLLSEMRTDLDTFTEVESYALMASGYLMTKRKLEQLDETHRKSGLPGTWSGFAVHAPSRPDWPFQEILPILANDPAGSDRRARDLAFQLKVSRLLLGKVWLSVPALTGIAIAAAIAGVIAGAIWVYENRSATFDLELKFGVGEAAFALITLLIAVLIPMGKYIKRLGGLRRWLYLLALVVAGSVLSHLHLHVFDWLYKRRGRLERLLNLRN